VPDILVQAEALAKTFGQGETAVHALADIHLSVAAGEVVGLRGPSGSGKSTLLNLVACIQEPSAGRLLLGGEVVWDGSYRIPDLRRLRRERIGFIFQLPWP
jgi:putative ABC transport system ATP-binding protein